MEYEEHAWSIEELNKKLEIDISEANMGKFPGLSKDEAAR